MTMSLFEYEGLAGKAGRLREDAELAQLDGNLELADQMLADARSIEDALSSAEYDPDEDDEPDAPDEYGDDNLDEEDGDDDLGEIEYEEVEG